MNRPLALISGGGVAGLAAAWWLQHIGWRVVIVERSSTLREGGYMLGLSGPGYETIARMGLLPQLRAVSYEINENVYRDRHGNELLRLRYRDLLRDIPYLAVRRSDLINVLSRALAPETELHLATTATNFTETETAIVANLSNGMRIEADLLIAADGFRSASRKALFGDDTVLEPLGYRFAVYDVDDSLQLQSDFLSYAEPGHLAEYYALKDRRLAAMHVWRDHDSSVVPIEDRWTLLSNVAANSHPDVRRLIDVARNGAPPMIDSLTLVNLPRWSKGRITLLGDAAHCLTLVSGQGAGIAIASAEILAHSLDKTSVAEALLQHNARLRPVIERLQVRSRRMASMFIPETAIAFHIRNFMLRHIPRAWIGKYLVNSVRSEISLTAS